MPGRGIGEFMAAADRVENCAAARAMSFRLRSESRRRKPTAPEPLHARGSKRCKLGQEQERVRRAGQFNFRVAQYDFDTARVRFAHIAARSERM